MFTGIVEQIGVITAVEHAGQSAVLRIASPVVAHDAVPGSSIAVSGVCLTVVEPLGDEFTVDVMAQTLGCTSLGQLTVGARVNCERALAASGRFGGHIVQGHVDGTGVVSAREPGQRWEVVTVQVPSQLRRYLVQQGSVAIDGVSLTVSALTQDGLQVSLIPTTLAHTTLGSTQVGAIVNLEVDVLAKYVEKLIQSAADGTDVPRFGGESL